MEDRLLLICSKLVTLIGQEEATCILKVLALQEWSLDEKIAYLEELL